MEANLFLLLSRLLTLSSTKNINNMLHFDLFVLKFYINE